MDKQHTLLYGIACDHVSNKVTIEEYFLCFQLISDAMQNACVSKKLRDYD